MAKQRIKATGKPTPADVAFLKLYRETVKENGIDVEDGVVQATKAEVAKLMDYEPGTFHNALYRAIDRLEFIGKPAPPMPKKAPKGSRTVTRATDDEIDDALDGWE